MGFEKVNQDNKNYSLEAVNELLNEIETNEGFKELGDAIGLSARLQLTLGKMKKALNNKNIHDLTREEIKQDLAQLKRSFSLYNNPSDRFSNEVELESDETASELTDEDFKELQTKKALQIIDRWENPENNY